MTRKEQRQVPQEQRRCLHHEGFEARIQENKDNIAGLKKGLLFIYTLLVANLCTAITLLVIQLSKPVKSFDVHSNCVNETTSLLELIFKWVG